MVGGKYQGVDGVSGDPSRGLPKHLHSAYVGLQKSFQQEWAFVQRVAPVIGDAFRTVETALKETFVPMLFKGICNGVPERGVTCLPVKQVGLCLPEPSHTAPEKWTVSCVITGKIVAALRVQVEFRTADHPDCLQEGRMAVRQRGQRRATEALTAALEGAPVLHARQLQGATKTGA